MQTMLLIIFVFAYLIQTFRQYNIDYYTLINNTSVALLLTDIDSIIIASPYFPQNTTYPINYANATANNSCNKMANIKGIFYI